ATPPEQEWGDLSWISRAPKAHPWHGVIRSPMRYKPTWSPPPTQQERSIIVIWNWRRSLRQPS
ncbi:MAG: hypothetical protein ACK51L_00040, partial [bacterium]